MIIELSLNNKNGVGYAYFSSVISPIGKDEVNVETGLRLCDDYHIWLKSMIGGEYSILSIREFEYSYMDMLLIPALKIKFFIECE